MFTCGGIAMFHNPVRFMWFMWAIYFAFAMCDLSGGSGRLQFIQLSKH